jgi:hypothetical protein
VPAPIRAAMPPVRNAGASRIEDKAHV